MAIEVKHSTQATGTDAGNGEIRKDQWNENHTLTQATARMLGRTTSGAGATEELDASAVRSFLNVENGATADQTGSEIEAAYNSQVGQVSAGEKTAGTETAVRRFSPDDVKDMIDTHSGGGSSIEVEDEGVSLTTGVTKFNFVGSGVTVTESVADEVTVTVAGGGAPVDSVNSQTGVVVLDADDIDDASTTHKFATAAQLSKVDGVESGATADQTDGEIETAYNNQVSQVSGAEKTAGTETAIRRFAPQDIAEMASTHGGAGVIFDTKAELEAATVAAGYEAVWVMGYSAAGDGGGAKYKRVGSEPSHAGKIQDAGGTWFELAEDRINVRMFGAYGDWSSSNQRDDTQAFQDAIDYVQTFPGGSDGFPMGYQGHVVYVPAGKYGITDTLDNTNARGFLSIIGDSQEASIIVWNKTTAGNIPFLDHGAKGENARFEDIRTYVPVGATLPSTWIKTTTFIDHGFSVKGAYFYNAEDSIIECAGALNANLHNWRCEGTNNTIIKVTDAGNQARTASIENFTLHAREASNGAEVVSDLNSFIDITLTTSNKKHFVWKNCSFELDTDAIASTFNFMVLRGNSTRHPAIITTFDGVGIFEQTTTATPTINLFNGAGTSVHTAHVFRNFEMNALDNFATGNLEITSQGIPAARFVDKWVVEAKFSSTDQVTWHAGSGDVATQQVDITGSTTVDARDLHGTLIQLTATADSDLATISNARPGQIIHLVRAGASSAVTIKHNTGNINLSGGDLTLSNVRILTLRYDSLQTRWVGNKGL